MELLIKAKDIFVEYVGRDILDIDELELYSYDRIGLVGANGTGKSTLLKVLLGELTPPGCKLNRIGEFAYIPQLDEIVMQEVKDFSVIGKLGVRDLDRKIMSGGEDTIQRVQGKEDVQILALTTCSYEFTDARTVILAIMEASPAE